MNLLERYIAKVILSAILMTMMMLLGVQSFIQLAAQLQDVGQGDFSWLQAFTFVPLMLPSDVYQLFPMAALIGSLMGLGRLAGSSELVVMRAAGVSLFRIAKAVLMTAVGLLLIMTLMGEVLGPLARDKALTLKTTALSQGQMLQTKGGVWLRDHNKFIHIHRINDQNYISGVTIYEFGDNNRLTHTRFAEHGFRRGQKWHFLKVRESNLYTDHIETQHLDKAYWPVHIDTHLVTLSQVDPNQQSLIKLHQYLQFRKRSGLGQGVYEFVFYKRLFQPIATLVMILLAIPFIFGPMQRSTFGFRIVVGIFMGFGFYIMNQFFGPMSQVYQIPGAVAAALPSIIFAILGLILLKLRA